MITRRLIVVLLSAVSLADGRPGFFSDLASNVFSGLSHGRSKKFDVAPVTEDKAKNYLQNFGYVSPTNLQTGGMAGDFDTGSVLKKAIMKFQEFAGLAKSGILDQVTKKKMAMPRCGFTDAPLAITASGSSSAFKWKSNHITYSIESWTPDLDRDSIRRAIREAYDKWAAVTPLTFEEVDRGQGKIKIKFGSGNHGDPWPFDGDGGVLAHATMPENGALHFDDDEKWAYRDPAKIGNDYTDLLAVAIHEGGHTLGLEHSKNDKAIMAPFYQSTVDDDGNYNPPQLTSDDIRAIQDIYGRGSGTSSWGGSSGRQTTRAPSWGSSGSNWGSSGSNWGSSGWGNGGRSSSGSNWGGDGGWGSNDRFGGGSGTSNRWGSSGSNFDRTSSSWSNWNPNSGWNSGWNSGSQSNSGGSSWGGGGSSWTTTWAPTTTSRSFLGRIGSFFGGSNGDNSNSNSGSSSSSSNSGLLSRAKGFFEGLG